MDADQVLETYSGIDFASSNSLMGRAFTHVACEDLAVGNVVNSFNAGIFGAAHPISLESLRVPTAQYIIVHKSDDGSSQPPTALYKAPIASSSSSSREAPERLRRRAAGEMTDQPGRLGTLSPPLREPTGTYEYGQQIGAHRLGRAEKSGTLGV